MRKVRQSVKREPETGLGGPREEIYRGSVNAWECDANGHMNVRFYGQRAMQGLGFLAARLGMARAFTAKANATLVPIDWHIRFLAEARMAQSLSLFGGLLDIGEADATAYLELQDSAGRPSATFTTKLAHVEPQALRRFPWSNGPRARALELMCAAPAHGRPRSIDCSTTPAAPTIARATELGAWLTGRAMVLAEHCDAFGRMRFDQFMARVTESAPTLLDSWRRDLDDSNAEDATLSGAVVEYRFVVHRWPRVGDLIEVRSGVTEIAQKTQRMIHWVLDPASGQAWGSAEVVAIAFDLKTRKSVNMTDRQRARFETRSVPGMTI